MLAAALAAGLLIAVVLLSGGGSGDDEVAEADAECLRSWNADPAALALGRHQANYHRYSAAQILRLDVDGGTLEADSTGTCTVAWAAGVPARELRASAQVFQNGKWLALNQVGEVTPEQLAELQDDAIAGANAGLNEQGQLIPF